MRNALFAVGFGLSVLLGTASLMAPTPPTPRPDMSVYTPAPVPRKTCTQDSDCKKPEKCVDKTCTMPATHSAPQGLMATAPRVRVALGSD